MSMTMTQTNQTQSFFSKYKKWIIALLSLQLIPTAIMLIIFGGGAIYLYSNNDTNFHPYKSYIMKGFRSGYDDGLSDKVWGQTPKWTDWGRYWRETEKLQAVALTEQQEYLAQFPESERGIKLAEMKQEGIKTPTQKQLEGRFTNGIDFYADLVKQRVNRAEYNSEEEYNEALQDTAWKVGYAHGYREGLAGSTERVALRSIKY